MTYKGFTIYYYNYVPRIAAWNTDLGISFANGLTDMEYVMYNRISNYKEVLLNTMKWRIDQYLKYMEEEQNEYSKS